MYKIIFENNAEFIGNDPPNTKWNDMPNNTIKAIQYSIDGFIFQMENFEKYNHHIEYIRFILNKHHQSKMSKIILMGCNCHQKVFNIYVDLIKHKIYTKWTDWGTELNGRKTTGWKMGIKNEIPKYSIL